MPEEQLSNTQNDSVSGEVQEKWSKVYERYTESRAGLVTQMFVTLATAHGVGMTAIISFIGQAKSPTHLTYYLGIAVFILAAGLLLIIGSSFSRFNHSKIAELKDYEFIKKGESLPPGYNKNGLPFYRFLMYLSALCLAGAIFTGVYGVHKSRMANVKSQDCSHPGKVLSNGNANSKQLK